MLASREATQGHEIFLQDGSEGCGPPPHAHPWDESFYVIRGVLEVGFDETRLSATAGTFVHVPAGRVHWFRFGPGGGQMLSVSGGGSQAASLFTDIDAELPAGVPPDLPTLQQIALRNGLLALHVD